MKGKYIYVILAALLAGCGVLNPYDGEFQCERGKDYGKCISTAEAYKESLRGGRDAIGDADATVLYRKDESGEMVPVAASQSQYKTAEYIKMRQLVEAPVSPVVVPPVVLRTLIAGYKTGSAVYSPRFIHYFANDPQFLMGEELPDNQFNGRRTIYPNGK